ncbi:MAG TPA: PLD nuclease N-terminal domain-containing protein [Planctomycetota bacterium]|nr:PLD nuclease N-terminal domain-containing protein [Planctomycetota bacterium]
MDEERRRILRMLSEGSITVEECEELLKALSERRTEKVVQEVEAAQGERPVWPYVLLVALAAVGVVLWLGVGGLFAARSLSRRTWGFPLPLPFPMFMFGGLVGMAALVLWIWMLIDCIARLPCDFRLLFTSRHEYDKWIWIAAILLTNWVGALVYLVVIRQHARAGAAGVAPQPSVPEALSEEPFTPSPRARSILWFFVIGVVLALGAAVAGALLWQHPWMGQFAMPVRVPFLLGFGLPVAFIVMAVWLGIFWLWMLIDCLGRDHREFGTLITTDNSADKILWLLLILFTTVIGAIAYHIVIRRRPRPTSAPALSGTGGRG